MINNDQYVLGVLGLALSLKKVKSNYPLILYLTDNISIVNLELFNKYNIDYCIVKDINYILQQRMDNYKCRYVLGPNNNKAYAYTLKQYEKVCWLDADMLVLKNIDYLFKMINTPAYMYLLSKCDTYTNEVPINGWFFYINPNEIDINLLIEKMQKSCNDENIAWEFYSKYFINNYEKHDIFQQIHSLREIYHDGHSIKWWYNLTVDEIYQLIMNKTLTETRTFLDNFTNNLK